MTDPDGQYPYFFRTRDKRLSATATENRPDCSEAGFSLIEQIVAVALIGVVAVPLLLLLSGLVRGASVSEVQVKMINTARAQMENVKQQAYRDLPTAYDLIDEVPEEFILITTVSPVKTYTYPEPDSGSTLPDEIQLVTVTVSCPGCKPTVGDLTLSDHKARR